MNREFLREQGLTEEQVEAVIQEHGKTVNDIKEKAEQTESLESQIEDLNGQIAERDQQLEDLSEKAKDNEELTAEINRLKDENKTATEELQSKLDQQAFEFTLDKALTNAGVRNPKAVKALLDTKSIKLDDDKLLCLDSQVETLKESDSYLFKTDEPEGNGPQIVPPGNPNGGSNIKANPFSKENWNLTEQGKLYKENPDLYKHYKAQAGK